MSKRLVVVVFVAYLAAVSVVSRADIVNLIENGSFEKGSFSDLSRQGFMTLNAGSKAIDCWTVGGNGVDWISTYWTAADLDRSIDMSATQPGILISQKFTTVAGRRYELSFALGANPERDPNPKKLDVSVIDISGKTVGAGHFEPLIVDKDRNKPFDVGWTYQTLRFTAISDQTTLTFTSGTSGACGPTLDDVSVVPVPVPAAIVLGVVGLGLLGWAKRRHAA